MGNKANNNTWETTRARQIKFIDENIDGLQLSTFLPQTKYNLIVIVKTENQPD